MPPIDPQQIPYQPMQPPPPQQFQGGPYAQILSQQIAKQPTTLESSQSAAQSSSEMLQNYLKSQQLQQQAPLIRAQTGQAQAQTGLFQQQQYGSQLVDPSTGQPDQGATLSGVSAMAPQPGGGMPGASGTTAPQGNQPPMGGGQGQQMPMTIGQPGGAPQPNPMQSMAPQPGQGDPFAHMHMDPSQPYNLAGGPQQGQGQPQMGGGGGNQPPQGMVPRSGLFNLQQAEGAYQAEAKLLAQSPQFKSVFGGAQAQDIVPMLRGAGQPGTLTKGLMELAGTQNKLNFENQKFTFGEQNKVKVDANKEFGEYTTANTDIQTAQKSLEDAKANPAMFNVALANIAKVVGITSRKPQAVADYISGSDPSLAGEINAFIEKKGAGQLPPQLYTGLQNMMADRANTTKSTFETKAQSRIQQNLQMFGNDPNQAKSALYPNYQWGGQTSPSSTTGGGGQGQYTQVRQNSKTGQKVGLDRTTNKWVPIQ